MCAVRGSRDAETVPISWELMLGLGGEFTAGDDSPMGRRGRPGRSDCPVPAPRMAVRSPGSVPQPGTPTQPPRCSRGSESSGGPPLLSPWVGVLALTPGPLPPEWFASSTQSYILRDLDDTSVVEDGRKKLNTLAHYKVGSDPTHPAPPHRAALLTSTL